MTCEHPSGQASGVRRQASGNLQFAIYNLQFAIVCLAILATFSISTAADPVDNTAKDQQRSQLLDQMRALAHATNVRYQQGDRQSQLVESPVFRYDDQPRRFIDATMWVWTDTGRPVAFQKVEAMANERPEWQYCFTSVSDKLLAVSWGGGRSFQSTRRSSKPMVRGRTISRDDGRSFDSTVPGVEFRLLADAPLVPARSTTRKTEARKVVRDFSARILTDDRTNTSEEMRLLPTPILEYSDPESEAFLGAVFGLTTSGTNPDLLILLEPRDVDGQPVWHYAVARMTTGGVTLKYKGKTIAEIAYVQPRPTAFPTWTFFSTPRDVFDERNDAPARSETLKVAK